MCNCWQALGRGTQRDPSNTSQHEVLVTQEKFTHRSVFTPESSRGSVKGGPTEYFSIPPKKFVPVPKLQVSLVEKLATNVDLYQ